ncbi:MAG TPA: fatty acid--CoA ligase family protein [Acidimicrobiales bacterium]|nr:fatty acid--CoA ligase family protein [Acidimicrobiales bacterium]
MRRLRVVEARGGDAFVDTLRRAWDAGDAVLPLDPRLPPPARRTVLAAARPHEPVEEGDALVVATSGTTGEPKAVVLTHQAVAASARATSARLGVDPTVDRWLACLPLAHVGGLAVVTRALLGGTPLTVHDGFDAGAVEAAARTGGATLVALVPTALRRVDASLFRTVVLGGTAMPAGLPPNAVTTYGMTETGSGVVYDGEPLDGVEVRVTGGQVHLRGPMLLRGYRDGTDPRDGAGWLATGDAGRWDEATGRLHVEGRIGDVIVTGGEKVWPAAVERALAGWDAVAEVAVVGHPDPEWGQAVVAVVVPARPGDPPRLEEARAVVRAALPAYAAPRRLVVVPALPRTGLGKVARRALAASLTG